MYDEQGNEVISGLEVLPSSEALDMADNAALDISESNLEQEGDLLEHVPEVPAENLDAGTATSYTLSSERVEQIVDAVLESDKVTSMLNTFTYTLESISDALTMTGFEQEQMEQEPVLVISADELLDRLEARQAETAQAVQAAEASVKSAPAATRGGEILIPEEEELLPLEIIVEVVQAIYEHFQQDDIDTITEIRDAVSEIKASVEPHQLMDTPFWDYTVTEGLLLVIVLWFIVINPCIRMIKEGFSWLL